MNKIFPLTLIALGLIAVLATMYFGRFKNFKPKVSTPPVTNETPSSGQNDLGEPRTFGEQHEVSGGEGKAGTEIFDRQPLSEYPLHKNVTATVFWVGEPVGNGSSEDNALSAWDDDWQKNFGGFDDPVNRNGYFPKDFTPKENPFYLDVPYNDFTDDGERKANAYEVVPWASEKKWAENESMMKNRWVKLMRGSKVCYGQIEDSGPYEYDDYNYVFGDSQPKSFLANQAGLDVSPALRDCLQFEGLNNDLNRVDWQFVEFDEVPKGPWTLVITESQINWK
jgi:hypothetical protein